MSEFMQNAVQEVLPMDYPDVYQPATVSQEQLVLEGMAELKKYVEVPTDATLDILLDQLTAAKLDLLDERQSKADMAERLIESKEKYRQLYTEAYQNYLAANQEIDVLRVYIAQLQERLDRLKNGDRFRRFGEHSLKFYDPGL